MLQLNFKKYGEGEPLVILHGLLGSLDNWNTIAKKLAEDFTVYIVDARNHGKSFHSDNFNYELMSEDLNQFLTNENLDKIYLLGHSMGGKTAMKFATDYPEKVEKLIVADMAPVNYTGGHEEIFKAILSADLENATSRKDIDSHLKKSIPNFGVRQFIMKGLTRDDDNTFVWKFNVKALWANYDSILKATDFSNQFEKPVLFLAGANSSYIKESYKSTILDHFPKASFDAIENAGHWLHAEQPEKFIEITTNFLSK